MKEKDHIGKIEIIECPSCMNEEAISVDIRVHFTVDSCFGDCGRFNYIICSKCKKLSDISDDTRYGLHPSGDGIELEEFK
jgi:hypothetical protein